MTRYKYANAREWLYEYLRSLKLDSLYNEAVILVDKLDEDTIQDIYQSEMDADGYFDDLDTQQIEVKRETLK